ncbi:MAG: hypothetical protein IT310_06010 [Anaerolineales bacterium]|nr:hypothetical protein [Anaerolineales bacterium]
MKRSPLLSLTLSLLLLSLSACAPKAPTLSPQIVIQQSVAETLAALPTATQVPFPTPYPTPTPMSLAGLFCEYQFCIGHPADLAFFDLNAQKNPTAPSSYNQGIITAFNITTHIFLQVMWQSAPGATDPQPMLETILDDAQDAAQGNKEIKLVRNMNVVYTAITSTATALLPYGGAGAWNCGDRLFAWKAYAPEAASAGPLFEEAIARFTCGQ